MNQREAFRAICRFEPVADMPLWQFQGCMGGVLPETLDRWVNEERFPPARSGDSLADYLGFERPELIPIGLGMWPRSRPSCYP